MLRELKLGVFLLLGVSLLLCGCTKSVEDGAEPTLWLDCYELNIDGGGGDIPLYYAVSNGRKGEKPSVSCGVSWIKMKEITDTKIILTIDPSDQPEERFAIVSVTYPDMKDNAMVYVTQDKQLLNQFAFEVTDVTYKSCTVKYVPADKSISYMANVIDKEYFSQSGIDTAELFVETEMNNYLALAQANGLTLEEVMSRISPQLIYQGDAVRKFNGMQHGATYVVYSYGVEFSGNEYRLTTPIHHTLVELPMPQMYDVTFDVTHNIHNMVANIIITPQDWNGYYSVQVAPDYSMFYIPSGEQITEFWMRSLANNFFKTGRTAMWQGASAESFMKSNCCRGPQQINIPVESGYKYMAIIFAVKSEDEAVPVMCSVPTTVYL